MGDLETVKILLVRTHDGFVPRDDEAHEACKRFGAGSTVWAEITQPRNLLFHRKFFALVKLAYDAWTETCQTLEYKGQPVLPSFDRFRKDLMILAGFYKPVWNIRGEMRVEADSIAFGNMDQDRFEQVYSAVIDAILQKVLPNRGFTEQRLRQLVEEVVRFG
jgi:hypothetical protein